MKIDGTASLVRQFRAPTRAGILMSACLAGSLISLSLADGFRAAGENDQRPTLTARLSSLKAAYADLHFVFDLVGDPRGYRDFQETLDLALDGIATDRPCEITVLSTPGGLQTVGYLPAATNNDFHKFLQALADADVRTSSTIPSALRSTLPSVRLQPNERIIVSLYEGFVRFDEGYVRLGHDLEAVRRPQRIETAGDREATATVRMEGSSASPDVRRTAFRRSREKILAKLKKEEQQTTSEFALQKGVMDGFLSALELVFAESFRSDVDWSMSHDKKHSRLDWMLTPDPTTLLASDLQRIQRQTDAFADVSRQGTVLSASWNLPLNASLLRPLKSVIASVREVERERIQKLPDLSQDQKVADQGLIDLVFDIADDIAGGSESNGFLRTWPNGDRRLTTVAALRVVDASRYRDRVRALKSQEVGRLKTGDGEVEVCKLIASKWPREQKELFDREGAVFVAVGKEAIWLGLGDNALQRLEQSAAEAGTGGRASGMVMTLSARMLPLSDVWSQIRARHPAPTKTRSKPKSETKDRGANLIEEKPSITLLKEIAADLNLPAIAAKAYQHGSDVIEVTLNQEGDQASLSARFEEGTLRFVGEVLSKFAKDNF